jgi:hypothetical protein
MDKDIVAVQTWWMGELKALTKKVAEQEERRQARERERAEKKLGEYRTYSDVQDAYGCGVITERKAYQLYDLLDKINPEEDRLYLMKLDLLAECYQIAKKAVEGHGDE